VEFQPLAHQIGITKMLAASQPRLRFLEAEVVQTLKNLFYQFEQHDSQATPCLRGRRPVRADRRLRADDEPVRTQSAIVY